MKVAVDESGNAVVTDESGAFVVNALNLDGHPSSATATDGTAPTYHEENGIKYLTFATATGEDGATLDNRRSAVNVQFNTGDVVKQNNITIEAWARPNLNGNADAWSYLAAMGQSHNSSGYEKFGVRFSDEGFVVVRPDNQRIPEANGGNLVLGEFGAEDEWSHYVITRNYTEPAEGETLGTWTSTLYVNGVKMGEESVKETTDQSTSSKTWLSIGSPAGGESARSFIGDIADFKVYTGTAAVEAEANALRSYAKDATAYTGKTIVNKVFYDQNDAKLDYTNIITATKIKIRDMLILSRDTDEKPLVAVAAYRTIGNAKQLVKLKVLNNENFDVVQDGELYNIIANAEMDVEGLNVDSLKLFVWDTITSLRPVDLAESLAWVGEDEEAEGVYTLDLSLANLQANSVKKENFTITNAAGTEVSTKSAVYLPQQNKVVLTFDDNKASGSTYNVSLSNVLCVGGATPGVSALQGNATLSTKSDIYGVSVAKLTFEQGGVSVLKPNLAQEFKVNVSVINTTKAAKSDCEVLIYLDSYADGALNKNDAARIITIGAESTTNYEFTVTPAALGGLTSGAISVSVQ